MICKNPIRYNFTQLSCKIKIETKKKNKKLGIFKIMVPLTNKKKQGLSPFTSERPEDARKEVSDY